MRSVQLRQRNGSPVEAAAISDFREGFAGRVIDPQDEDYETARRIWNLSIDKRPGLIARCFGTADVVRAVNFARKHDILVAVRGGGHNVAGRALCDDGLVIDLSSMASVFVAPQSRTVRAGAGCTLGHIDRETHLHGLSVPLGVVSRTGVAGLSLGGGVGWLVRKYGFTCDNLMSCEVVTADGEVLTASPHSNPDLFWALRGGGGNFGIVTSFLFQAHPVSTVLGGLIVYPREAAAALLRHYRDYMPTAPDELTAYAGLISLPDGTPASAVVVCYCGDLREGERVVAPFRNFMTPLMDAVQPIPMVAMQSMLDGAFPDNTYNYWKSAFVDKLSDETIDLIVEHGNRATSPLSGVVVELYGGAASRVAPGETAFNQRHRQFNVAINAQWFDPAESDEHTGWARAMWDALQPVASDGYFLNYLGDEAPAAIRATFGSNYARLADIKAKYDPDNFFSLNQNVTPSVSRTLSTGS